VEIPGTRIVLREYRPETDDEDFYHWWNLAEWQYYDEPDLPFDGVGREVYERRLERSRRRPEELDPSSHSWQIETVDGRHIGFVNYYELDEAAGRAHVGIGLPEEEAWGQGYGTEALGLLLGYLFGTMGLEEVRTTTWTGNARMKRVAAKCGFQEIGRSPYDTEFSVRGEQLERIEYSLSRAAWLARGGGG
jgi:RimJ/RimL family protein N-acetyltransferase